MYMLYMIAVITVFYFGSESVLEGAIQIGILVTFHRYVGDFFDPIQQLAEQFNTVQSAFAAGERIFAWKYAYLFARYIFANIGWV